MANESSGTESPMENVLHNSDRPTRKEQLQICCRPTYNIRRLRSKGAIVLLIGNYFVYSIYYYFTGHYSSKTPKPYYITWGLSVPVFGWLTDVCIGRHKMMRWSTWIMWLAFMLATTSSAIAQFIDNYHNCYNYAITLVLFIIASAGFGGYQANVIQYGLDQLHDASTDEITSFISWYVWTFISGGIVVDYVNLHILKTYPLLVDLLICVNLSIGLALFLLSHNLLIKEPVTQNPFKVVYRVIKYAIKNKRPRCRSAFTYFSDELPSRIDFGKRKFGGPFTTEQVEDVKTFIRLSIVMVFGCAIPSIVIGVNQLSNRINDFYRYDTDIYGLYIPFTKYTTGALVIPMYEFVLYPILRRHFSCIKSHYKLLLGLILQMARVVTLISFMLNTRHSSSLEPTSYNVTTNCIFQENHGALELSFNDKWIVLPDILNSLSIATLAIGSIEFICAQTPYSMRGLMFGVAYGIVAVFALVEYGIIFLFSKTSFTWATGLISCGFWYLLLNILFLGIDGIMLVILSRWYKKRKREDVLPNEQIFAERYYTN